MMSKQQSPTSIGSADLGEGRDTLAFSAPGKPTRGRRRGRAATEQGGSNEAFTGREVGLISPDRLLDAIAALIYEWIAQSSGEGPLTPVHRVPGAPEGIRGVEPQPLVTANTGRAAIAKTLALPGDDLATIGPVELGRLLGRSTAMVQVDATRRPLTLPPQFKVPGVRKLRWRVVDVREWMDALAELEAERRAEQVRLARKTGTKTDLRAPIDLASRELRQQTTDRILSKRREAKK